MDNNLNKIDKLDKLDNLEIEIIKLLYKKYDINNSNIDVSNFKLNTITKDYFKININNLLNHRNNVNEEEFINDLIKEYTEIETALCYYDIDIMNMVIKYISLNREITINIEKYKNMESNKNKDKGIFYDIVNYIFNKTPKINNRIIPRDLYYFKKKFRGINTHVKPKLFGIAENIIVPYSTYILL